MNEKFPEHQFQYIGMGNEIPIDDSGWAVIPYGDWPHQDGMQHFGAKEAELMVGYFKNTWNKIKRVITGLPVFKGHPDHPSFANQYKDKTEYGQVADMEARTEGLAVRMIVGAAGAKLIANGLKFISPHWLANVIGGTAERPVYAPCFIKSIGLTDNPNIPVKSLLNSAAAAAAQHQKENHKMEKLKTLLGLANESTEEQIVAAVTALQARPEPQALALANEAKTAMEGKVAALTSEKDKVTGELTKAQTALANERKSRIGDILAQSIRTGKITEADKPVWEKRLEANFTDELATLANAKPAVKTESDIPKALAAYQAILEKELANANKAAGKNTDGGGEGDDDDSESNLTKINCMVNAEASKPQYAHMAANARHNAAYANVKRANPKLFADTKK